MSAGARVDAPPIVLDMALATLCPVKTRHAAEGIGPDRVLTLPGRGSGPVTAGDITSALGPADPAAERREAERAAFTDEVLDRLLAGTPDAADLRPVSDRDARCRATLAAMRAGRRLVIRPELPIAGHRAGSAEALLRSDEGTGLPAYQPVLVRWHRVLRRLGEDEGAGTSAETGDTEPVGPYTAELDQPLVTDNPDPQRGLRLATRRADFLGLAHQLRLLEAVGLAGGPWGAVVGTDGLPGRPQLAWIRLDRPMVTVVDHTAPDGRRRISLLEDADRELAHRLAIADAIRAGVPSPGDVVAPAVIDECRSCPWWSACRDELDPDDVSRRIARGRLDRIEVNALRARGVTTVTDLAAVDVDALLPAYLPEVVHRADGERRLRTVARRARMLQRGASIERETTGPISVPQADLEIDLDIETSAEGRVYLWGFGVARRGAPPVYVRFARFADLDQEAERALAHEALDWLRRSVEPPEDGPRSALVFHYSAYEVAMISALAARHPDDSVLAWAAPYAQTAFVDVLTIVQQHFFGATGLGLKQIAVTAGFAWRDPDPGGLNSQRWFDEAVHAHHPAVQGAARNRVLTYNEDDVRATAHLRAWLRAQ